MSKKKETLQIEKEKKVEQEMKKKEKERQEAEEKKIESIKVGCEGLFSDISLSIRSSPPYEENLKAFTDIRII